MKKLTSSIVAPQQPLRQQSQNANKSPRQCTSTKPTTTMKEELGQNEQWCMKKQTKEEEEINRGKV